MQGPASVAGHRTDRSCGGSFSRNPVTSLDQCPLCWLVRIYTFRSSAQGPTEEKERPITRQWMSFGHQWRPLFFFLLSIRALHSISWSSATNPHAELVAKEKFTSPAGRVSSMKKGTSAHLSPPKLEIFWMRFLQTRFLCGKTGRQTTSWSFSVHSICLFFPVWSLNGGKGRRCTDLISVRVFWHFSKATPPTSEGERAAPNEIYGGNRIFIVRATKPLISFTHKASIVFFN